jgi:hypothetical protein
VLIAERRDDGADERLAMIVIHGLDRIVEEDEAGR